jgi:hypothetical protein
MITLILPSEKGSVSSVVLSALSVAVVNERLVPKIEIRLPGANGPVEKSDALTMLDDVYDGACAMAMPPQNKTANSRQAENIDIYPM